VNGAAPDAGRIAGIGALAAWGVAASYLASGLFALLMPPELQGRPEITPEQFWTVLSQEPNAHLLYHAAFVSAGLFGLAAVPALSAAVWRAHPGAVLWAGSAGWLGFAVLARSHLMELAWDRQIIPLYPTASPAFREAVHVVAGLALDVPDGVLTYGAIGAWVAVVAVLARRLGAPRSFAWLGGLAALSLVAGMVGYALLLRPLLVLSIGAGGFVLLPAWFAGAALWLRRTRHPAR